MTSTDHRPGAGLPGFAEVAVAMPVPGTYSYAVPARLAAQVGPGVRVLVRFGNRGVSGVVVRLADKPPEGVTAVVPLQAVLDDVPPVPAELLALCMWVADYYEAPPGEVLRAALPAGTAVAAAPRVALTEAGRAAAAGAGGAVPGRQRDVLARLAGAAGPLTQKELLRLSGGRTSDLEVLDAAGLIERSLDAGRARVRVRREVFVVAARLAEDDERAALARAPRRRAVLEAVVAEAGAGVALAALRARLGAVGPHVKALLAMGLVRTEERAATLTALAAGELTAPAEEAGGVALNAAQLEALRAIGEGEGFRAYLLAGITGSGKTEVYLHAIGAALAAGRGAIVLVPEISLTPQLASRFRARFGAEVAVLHSGLSDRDRLDEWQRLRSGDARIALGARSAVFAPVAALGIIVVDEEHDGSFKQEEGVRYHARDVALVRAQRVGGVCVLGSATPSLESWHAARAGRYRLVRLPERATPRPLPTVEIVDLKQHLADGDAMLTAPLAEAISCALAAGDQTILFLNRRGFATFVLCRACGHAFRCPSCSVSLTYHQARDRLMCHYCGHSERVPGNCNACGGVDTIERKGIGTERVAAALVERFPAARIARLDRDVASGSGVEAVLARVARREVDILIGTQMVTKGHDFPGVTLVGVLCADTGLSLPDFRASERTFQLLTQVAGRAGRGDRAGRVIIQTYRPTVAAVVAAAQHDHEAFCAAEEESRRELGYPPFGRLVAIRVDGPDAAAVERAARALAGYAIAQRDAEVDVLGPSEAPLARLKGRSRWHMWLRSPRRDLLRRLVRAVERETAQLVPAGVRVSVDVDPVSAL